MTVYHFFLSTSLKVNAAIERESEQHYICTVECDLIELVNTVQLMQDSVDAALIVLDLNRQAIEKERALVKYVQAHAKENGENN